MTDQQPGMPTYPQTRDELFDLPMCPVQWPGPGARCSPDWSGECMNCGMVVCQPKEEGMRDAPY